MIKRGEKRKRKREKPILCFTMIKQFVCYWDIMCFYQQYLINITFCIFKNKISDILNRKLTQSSKYYLNSIYFGDENSVLYQIQLIQPKFDILLEFNNVLIFWKCYSFCIFSSDIVSNPIESIQIRFSLKMFDNVLIRCYYFPNIIIFKNYSVNVSIIH